MYGVELYAAVRLAVVDEGLSHHEAGRRFGIDRRTCAAESPSLYRPATVSDCARSSRTPRARRSTSGGRVLSF